jgi:kinesin family protein 5
MYGIDLYDEQLKGIIPRAIDDIFEYIEDENNSKIQFQLKFSMLEIYKENLYDLINPSTQSCDLKIKEHPKKGMYVTNLSEEYIYSQEEMLILLENSLENRTVSETGLNKNSSRSHLLFQLKVVQNFPDETSKIGILNMVDLAGSEKVINYY